MTPIDLFDVRNKVAIVTGASSGLGVDFAEALADSGASIEIAARRTNKLASVTKRIGKNGERVKAFTCDVTRPDDVDNLIADTVGNFGSLDILVNNAGSTILGSSTEMGVDDWNNVLSVNLTGVFLCARGAAKQMMKQRKGGKIINIASIFGLMADVVPEPPYYASKAGVIGLTKYLAVEWSREKINVNCIAPGFFRTEMNEESLKIPGNLEKITRRTPLGRLGDSNDLKGVLLFLSSAASNFVTGQTIVVDGGRSIWL